MTEPVVAVRKPITPTSRVTPMSGESKPVKGGGPDTSHAAIVSSAKGPDMNGPAPVTDRPAQAPPAQAPVYNEWHLIDPDSEVGKAPKDGRTVWLADAKGNMCEAVWRRTRRFGMEKNQYGKWIGRWTEAGYWSVMSFSGNRVPFRPVYWHE